MPGTIRVRSVPPSLPSPPHSVLFQHQSQQCSHQYSISSIFIVIVIAASADCYCCYCYCNDNYSYCSYTTNQVSWRAKRSQEYHQKCEVEPPSLSTSSSSSDIVLVLVYDTHYIGSTTHLSFTTTITRPPSLSSVKAGTASTSPETMQIFHVPSLDTSSDNDDNNRRVVHWQPWTLAPPRQ